MWTCGLVRTLSTMRWAMMARILVSGTRSPVRAAAGGGLRPRMARGSELPGPLLAQVARAMSSLVMRPSEPVPGIRLEVDVVFFGDAAHQRRGADAAPAWADCGAGTGAGFCDCGSAQMSAVLVRSRRAVAVADDATDHGDDGVDLDGCAFRDLDLGEDAGDGRGNLGVDLVGGDLEERLVVLDGVADLLEPLGDGAFEDGLAHLRHDDIDRCHCGWRWRAGIALLAVGTALSCRPMTATTVLMLTVAPSGILISVRTPATGEGISASTLSVEISKSGSSFSTRSPGFLSHLVMVPSKIDSPIWGMITSVGMNPSLRDSGMRLCGPRSCRIINRCGWRAVDGPV